MPHFDDSLARAALGILILSSVFQGLSVLALRLAPRFQVGIAPYWIVAALVVLAALPSLPSAVESAARRLPRSLRWAAISLALFTLYGALSAFSLPFVFHGIAVLDPRLGIANQFMDPSTLSWSPSNAGQAAYIILNCAVFGLLVIKIRSLQDFRVLYRFVLTAGWLVLGFALFQRISTTYLPNAIYPALYNITHNNPAASSYPLMDPRTTSFFLEPSFLGGFAAAMFAVGLSDYLCVGRRKSLALGTVSAYVILSSESTVGLALIPLGIIVALLTMVGIGLPSREDGPRPALRMRLRNVLLGLVFAIVLFAGEHVVENVVGPWRPATLAQPTVTERVGSPVPSASAPGPATSPGPALLQPTQLPVPPSSTAPAPWLLDIGSRPWANRLLSVRFRLWADEFSIFAVPKSTWFLGAGLGSNRPSSFLAYVLSNTGIPGLLSMGSFLALVVVYFSRHRAGLAPPALAICAGMFTYTLAMFGGLPDPSWPPFFWLFGGLAVAGLGLAAVPTEPGKPVSKVK